jgi:hypothetical protein
MISLILLSISFLLILTGLSVMHGELDPYFNEYFDGRNTDYYNNEYYSDEEFNGVELIKGFFEIFTAIIILISVKAFLGSTIELRSWWFNFKALKERDCSWNVERLNMQSNVTILISLYYGIIVFSAFVLIIFGFIYFNMSNNAMAGVAFIDIMIGTVLIYIAYLKYQRDIARLSDVIFPMLEPIKTKELKKSDDEASSC